MPSDEGDTSSFPDQLNSPSLVRQQLRPKCRSSTNSLHSEEVLAADSHPKVGAYLHVSQAKKLPHLGRIRPLGAPRVQLTRGV